MIRNKWMWTGLLVCACIAAALAVRPIASKLNTNSLEVATVSQGSEKLAATAVQQAGTVQLNSVTNGSSKLSFGTPRALTTADRGILATERTRVSEADKQAAAEARALLPREPRTPSLDQGSDNCAGVPDLGSALGVAVATGTTAGATNNRDSTGFAASPPTCWQGTLFTGSTVGPDVYYKWTAPAAGNYTFSLCAGSANGNTYDTGITLWNFTCPTEPTYPANFICGNDDGGICAGNFGSELTCVPLTSGQQILIVVDAYAAEVGGAYSLDITQCAPCSAPACPGGWTAENEPDCGPDYEDNTNGGANSDPCVFTNVSCGATICAESGTFLVGGTGESRDTDWYRIVLTDTTRVTWNAVGEFDLSSLLLVPGPTGFECVLDSVGVLAGPFSVAPCETLSVSGCFTPGEYWIFVGPTNFNGVACGARYNFWVECETCVITECVEGTVTVDCVNGTSFTGNTTGAGDDCYVSGTTQSDTLSEDQIWEIIITQDGLYSFSLCDTGAGPSWDSYIFLTTGCCSGTILNDYAADDDRCLVSGGMSATECLPLVAGTYYLFVEGWQQTASGPYTVNVECCPPCIVTCVDNEAEVDCVDGFEGTNDGCNMDVPSFEAITCGATKCGTSGNYAINDTTNGRDLDWYVITLTDTTRITATATAEFDNNVWIISSNCVAPVTLGFNQAVSCSTNTATACLDAGTYYVVVGPQLFEGTACGARYQLTVNCEPCVLLPVAPRTCTDEYSMDGTPMDQVGIYTTIGVISDINTGGLGTYRRWERFTVTDSICKVEFWGIHLGYNGALIPCDTEDPMGFRIRIHPDSAGRPTTNPTCDYTTSLFRVGTGFTWNVNGVGITQVYYYSADLPTCCLVPNGWVSIEGNTVAAPNRLFYWSVGNGTDNNQHWSKTNTNALVTNAQDLAFCLSTNPPPCNPITNLTVVVGPGNSNARLQFTAPQTANYVIYSTTNPNADENPDNGADANYVVEANVFLTAGVQTWNAPAGFANYKKFVVVASCN